MPKHARKQTTAHTYSDNDLTGLVSPDDPKAAFVKLLAGRYGLTQVRALTALHTAHAEAAKEYVEAFGGSITDALRRMVQAFYQPPAELWPAGESDPAETVRGLGSALRDLHELGANEGATPFRSRSHVERESGIHGRLLRFAIEMEILNERGIQIPYSQMHDGLPAAELPAVEHPTPNDLCRTKVAISEFNVSRSTLRRFVRQRQLTDYSPADGNPNSSMLFSRKELGRFFSQRKNCQENFPAPC